jgi:hypothetical protein
MDTQYLTMITVFGYVLFVITFQAMVGIMTMMAAATTALWNIYKFIMDRRDRKRAIEKENGKVIDINTNKKQENE